MRVGSAETGRDSKNRNEASTHGRMFRAVGSQLAQRLASLNERVGAGECLGRTDDVRVVHELKPESNAHEV